MKDNKMLIGAVIIGILVVLIATGNLKISGLMATLGLEDDYQYYDDFMTTIPEITAANNLPVNDPCPHYNCGVSKEYTYTEQGTQCKETVHRSSSVWGTAIKECTGSKWAASNRYTHVYFGGAGDCTPNGKSQIVLNSGKLNLNFNNQMASSIIATKDFKGMDVKATLDLIGSCSGCNEHTIYVDILVNNQNVTTLSKYLQEQERTTLSWLFEIKSSRLDPSTAELYLNGNLIKTLTNLNELKIGFRAGTKPYYPSSSSLIISNFKYKIPFSCALGDDRLLAMESFVGGQEIGLYSMRYPVQSFCLSNPVIITSSTQEGATTTAEPYDRMIKGETLTIPEDQTWTVFYVLKNDGTLPVTCPEGAYNIETGRCTAVTGVVQICSEGTFDPAQGLCVVQAESVCAEGRFDTSTGTCIYNPPLEFICP